MKLPITPFKLDENFKKKPSSFEFIMIINNKNMYMDFSADSNRIYGRIFILYPNGRETEIFERTEINKFH